MNAKSGLDLLIEENAARLQGMRVGVLANQSAVSSTFLHLVDFLSSHGGLTLVRLFAPEHGFRGEHQDMALVVDEAEAKSGLEIVSLYGKTADSLKPKEAQLTDIDVLVVDLPDVGSRYYTFAQTLGLCLEVAAKTRTKVLVLDRPNPITGSEIEGSDLLASCRSFCGYLAVPQRHGLTLGELAEMMNRGFGSGANAVPALGAQLEVLKVTGWKRNEYADETGIPWVIPSPNMPTLDTAIVYPGGCLVEATQLSEGRGTTRPFEFIGAPGIDSLRWAAAALDEGISLTGASLRPMSFLPQFQKHGGSLCNGLQVHVTERHTFQPFRFYLALLFSLKRTHPDVFKLRNLAYEFVTDVPAMDLLYGSSELRDALESGAMAVKLVDGIAKFEAAYRALRKPFLLYPEA